jgi:hypothetical protein
MKMIKLLVSTAMVVASPTAFVTPAFATATQTPIANPTSPATLAAMQTQCNALAAAHDLHNGDIWTGEVVDDGVTALVSGPTETGNRVINLSTVVGSGTFTPGNVSIVGDPFRIGGSVNMFGNQWATGGHWSASTYDYTADFSSTFAHSFSCDISQEVYHPAVVHPYYEGIYVVNGDFGNSEDAVRGECAAYTQKGPPATPIPEVPWWGQDHGGNDNNDNVFHCVFQGTAPHTDPAFYDPPQLIGNEAGTPVNQVQTDNLSGHEANGSGFDIGGNIFVGQVVVCISPSKTVKGGVPGAWQNQNGYTGTKCNTTYFNIAPWGGGSQTSNGTYISVPPV